MWSLLIRVPQQEPRDYVIKSGRHSVGRKGDNDITIADPSASRYHAELVHNQKTDSVTINDLASTNGTFVNRERITGSKTLKNRDIIRIGGTTFDLSRKVTGEKEEDDTGSHRFTRELILESLDHHAVLLYEVSRQLNIVMDIDTALHEVSSLMEKAMGADRCEVIMAEDFENIAELQFPTTIADAAISKRSAVVVPDIKKSEFSKLSKSSALLRIFSVLCVPVVKGEEVIALVYMYKTDQTDRPFNQNDMQLAVAISHQTALTIQRMQLIDQIRKEQQAKELFQRFVSPNEVHNLVEGYLTDGVLPGLIEREVTIMFADIANSSQLAEGLGAKRFGDLLNRYYWDVTDTVFSNGGLVKYMGDGIMAVFGVTGRITESLDKDEQLLRAVRSAMSILDHIEVTDYGEEINIGVGMNTGSAMIGYVGTQERVELTAVGDVANVAFRLQKLARPNRLLIGPETAIGIAGKLDISDLGLREIEGRSQLLRIFEVIRKK